MGGRGWNSVESSEGIYCQEETLPKILIQDLNPLLTLVAFSTYKKIKLFGIILGILFLLGDEFGRFYSQDLLWCLRTGWGKILAFANRNPTDGFVLA